MPTNECNKKKSDRGTCCSVYVSGWADNGDDCTPPRPTQGLGLYRPYRKSLSLAKYIVINIVNINDYTIRGPIRQCLVLQVSMIHKLSRNPLFYISLIHLMVHVLGGCYAVQKNPLVPIKSSWHFFQQINNSAFSYDTYGMTGFVIPGLSAFFIAIVLQQWHS